MSAIPTLDLASAAIVCPICDASRKPRAFMKLYGVPVCKKCYYKFANRRQAAFIVDAFLMWCVAFAFGILLGLMFPDAFNTLADRFTAMDAFLLVWSWIIEPMIFALKDGFRGYSPGRWLTGVQVVDQITRQPISFRQSFKRNLCLIIPILPLVVAFTLAKGRRLGDKWAGTEVVWTKYRFQLPFDRRGILCVKCGYDLTGNQSGRCPECGTDIQLPLHLATASVRPVASAT